MSKPPRLFLSPPHMSGREQQYIAEVFETNYIAPVGPHLQRFEQAFAKQVGVAHAAALASGTSAIHLALRYLGLEPDDEVICPTFTFCASANPICYEQAKPVFIDSDWTSWNLDPNLVEDELKEASQRGKLPKAIVAVDILGQSADLDAINEIASRYELPVIEDAAEALGATYRNRPAGMSAWCSTFSFNGNKIITTGGGGMLCSDDQRLIEQARFLATQARDSAPYYEHSTIGYNYRLSNVLAAIGLAQLEVLEQYVESRRATFALYQELFEPLPGIRFMPIAAYGEPNYWLTTILIDADEFGMSCEEMRQIMEQHNIESRRVWKPMHQQPVFADCRCRGGTVAEEIFEKGLCLPSGSAMTTEDVRRVAGIVRNRR